MDWFVKGARMTVAKWRGLVLAAAMGASSSALADPTYLAIEDAMRLLAGLSELDGHDAVVKDGEKERIVKKPYVLGGGARLAIAKNMSRLLSAIRDVRQAEEALRSQYKSDDPALAKEIANLLAKTETFDLVPLRTDDLGLMPPTNNPIPPTTLSKISPIMKD